VSALIERLTATAGLAAERVRLLGEQAREDSAAPAGRDPERLRAEAARVREQEEQLQATVNDLARRLGEAEQARVAAEGAHAEEQARLSRLQRAAADRREGLARLAGQVAARRSRIEAGEAETERLRETDAAVTARATAAEREYAALETSVLDVEEGEEGLDREHEQAETACARARAEVEHWQEQGRATDSERSSLAARCE